MSYIYYNKKNYMSQKCEIVNGTSSAGGALRDHRAMLHSFASELRRPRRE